MTTYKQTVNDVKVALRLQRYHGHQRGLRRLHLRGLHSQRTTQRARIQCKKSLMVQPKRRQKWCPESCLTASADRFATIVIEAICRGRRMHSVLRARAGM